MSKPVDRIRVLISSLPERDIPLGHKFLDKRDFDSLKELVDSAMYKVKKSQRSENPKEIYAKVSLEDLSRLKSEVDMYIVQIEPPSEEDFYSEIEYELEEGEYY